MTAPIRTCPAHGPFAVDGNEAADDAPGDGCPVCGNRGEQVLSGARRRQLSKFVSGALRHFPADAGIEVDGQGWTRVADLASASSGNTSGPTNAISRHSSTPIRRGDSSGRAGRAAGRLIASEPPTATQSTSRSRRPRAGARYALSRDCAAESRVDSRGGPAADVTTAGASLRYSSDCPRGRRAPHR